MEELLELRGYIERQQYPEALLLIEELEEMSRGDKINKSKVWLFQPGGFFLATVHRAENTDNEARLRCIRRSDVWSCWGKKMHNREIKADLKRVFTKKERLWWTNY